MGRSDDLITAGGYRISPIEVESVLNQHPAILESAMVGKEIEKGKTIVKALIVLRQSVEPEKIIEFSKLHLASYKVPREIEFVENSRKTHNGKIIHFFESLEEGVEGFLAKRETPLKPLAR